MCWEKVQKRSGIEDKWCGIQRPVVLFEKSQVLRSPGNKIQELNEQQKDSACIKRALSRTSNIPPHLRVFTCTEWTLEAGLRERERERETETEVETVP